jgi:hypothetical protein
LIEEQLGGFHQPLDGVAQPQTQVASSHLLGEWAALPTRINAALLALVTTVRWGRQYQPSNRVGGIDGTADPSRFWEPSRIALTAFGADGLPNLSNLP